MNIRNSTIIGLIAAIAVITGIKTNIFHKHLEIEVPGDAMSEGDGDNPNARAQWELMRLADPATGKIPANIRARELAFAATLPKAYEYGTNARNNSSATWNWRGPYNVGGRTRALAIDATNENIILAGSVSGGMYRSTDGGATWKRTTGASQLPCISSVCQDTRTGKTNIWYYTTGEIFGPSQSASGAFYLGNGIFKSTDGGQSWVSLASTINSTPASFDNLLDIIHRVAVDPSRTDSDLVYAATIGAIFRSKDGGQNWKSVLGNTSTAGEISYATDIAITSNGVMYATMSHEQGSGRAGAAPGIWRSIDGIHWANITPASFPKFYTYIAIGIAPSDENQVYFIAQTDSGGKKIRNFLADSTQWYESDALWKYKYLSGDGTASGGRWVDLSNNLPDGGTPMDHFYAQGGYNLYVKVKPNDTNTVFIGGCDLYRSTDGFSSINNTTQIGGYGIGSKLPAYSLYPNNHPDQHALTFYKSNPNKMICGNDGGIWKTDDNTAASVSWTDFNRGYNTMQFYTVAIDKTVANDNTIIGGAQDNGTWWINSSNSNTFWTMPGKGDGAFCAIAPNKSFYYLSSQQGKTIKYALDASGQVTGFRRIDPITGYKQSQYLFVSPLSLDPNNSDIMYFAANNQLWRNDALSSIPLTNKYDSISTGWTKVFTDNTNAQVSAIAVCKNPANRVYIATSKYDPSTFSYAGYIYRIDNANSSGASITKTITLGGYVSSIAVHPDNGDVAIATLSNYGVTGIYYTSNAGQKWKGVVGNLKKGVNANAAISVRCAAILPIGNDTAYFIGTSIGLFSSSHILTGKGFYTRDSTTWVQQGPNTIQNSIVDMIEARPSDGLVVVATHGNGMYSANITDINQVGVKEVKVTYNQSELQLRNYPNPFVGQTNIEFNLPKAGRITLKLFDINGREVHNLYAGELYAGQHTMPLNAVGMPAGTYFCTLVTESGTSVQKILIQ